MANLSKVFSAELEGIEAKLVEVETDLHVGLHSFNIVGLADKALSEAKERVSSALKNCGVKPPTKENRKIVVNLAPADLKKTGSQYDLAIAVGYLLASGQIKEFNTADKLFAGELALDGSLRPVNGALNIARLAEKLKFKFLFLPKENADEAALVRNINVIPVKNLKEIISHLEDNIIIPPQPQTDISNNKERAGVVNLFDIKGQANAKRALTIAIAGGHNILMVGAPGGGKTMLAQAILSLLPPLSFEELLEATQIYSAAGLARKRNFTERPFRNPHHTISLAALVGGGSHPKPGEISLAHHGVLFLDELPEFRRDALEALRQPLEGKEVVISRVRNNLIFPANFTLVAAMNPCPCGYRGDDKKECVCTANEVIKYQKKLSGPLLDRIDIQINVPRVELGELRSKQNSEMLQESEKAKNNIKKTRNVQLQRNKKLNALLSSKECEQFIKLDSEAESFLAEAFNKNALSARSYYKILKIARTIADLENSQAVKKPHLSEAYGYRLREK